MPLTPGFTRVAVHVDAKLASVLVNNPRGKKAVRIAVEKELRRQIDRIESPKVTVKLRKGERP